MVHHSVAPVVRFVPALDNPAHSFITPQLFEFLDRYIIDWLQTSDNLGNFHRELLSYDFESRLAPIQAYAIAGPIIFRFLEADAKRRGSYG